MNKRVIRSVADFGPLLVFFIIYFKNENNLKLAIPPFIIATVIALIVVYILEKKIPMMPLISGILFFGKYFTNKPLLKIFFQSSISLQEEGWLKLNSRWIGFFILVAVLNEIVWRTQSEVFWVNFKVWGLLPISFLFAASQFPLINKYKLDNK